MNYEAEAVSVSENIHPNLHVLARAVIFVDGMVLLARAEGQSHTFLPGGHLEVGESLLRALEREVLEETAQRCVASQYIGAIEHSWAHDGQKHFEINHVFLASLPDLEDASDLNSAEQHLQFIFAAPDALELLNLKPEPVIGWIQGIARGQTPPNWASTLS